MKLATHIADLAKKVALTSARRAELADHMARLGHCQLTFESSNAVIVACDDENTGLVLAQSLTNDGHRVANWMGRLTNQFYVHVRYQ